MAKTGTAIRKSEAWAASGKGGPATINRHTTSCRDFSLAGSPASNAALLISIFLVLRLCLAAATPLTIDESYAVVVSRSHSLSYFDHPPIGFALARAMADLVGCECRFVVRLPYVLMGSLSAILLYDITRIAYGKSPAFWAVAWFTIAPFFFISAGHFVVPDGPLDFFLLAGVWAVAPMLIRGERRWALLRWTLAGIAIGLALMSKYQAVLFCVSAVLILTCTRKGRGELKTAGPWIAVAIAATGLLPVVIWNSNHDWISIAFQSGRAASSGQAVHPVNLILTLLGQIAYLWPVAWVLAIMATWRGLQGAAPSADRFFALIAVVPIAIFDVIGLVGTHSLPHWTMSGFLFTFPMVGVLYRDFTLRQPRRANAMFTITALALCLLSAGFFLQSQTGFLTRPFFAHAPKYDLGWQEADWRVLNGGAARQVILSSADAYVVSPDWMQAAKTGVALGPDIPIEVLPGDRRHFQFMNDARLTSRSNGFFIGVLEFGRQAEMERNYRAALSRDFNVKGEARTIVQSRYGFPTFELLVLPVERK